MPRTHLASPAIFGSWLEKFQDEVLGIIAHVFPVSVVEHHLGVAAFVDKILEILGSERRVATEKSVRDNAERPHVNGLTVTLFQHYFWGCISKRSCHGGEDFIFAVQHLRNAEISKDEVRVGRLGEVQ